MLSVGKYVVRQQVQLQTEVSSATRAVRNFFHLGGGGAISLAEVENMAACLGVCSQRDFRCSEAYSDAF